MCGYPSAIRCINIHLSLSLHVHQRKAFRSSFSLLSDQTHTSSVWRSTLKTSTTRRWPSVSQTMANSPAVPPGIASLANFYVLSLIPIISTGIIFFRYHKNRHKIDMDTSHARRFARVSRFFLTRLATGVAQIPLRKYRKAKA